MIWLLGFHTYGTYYEGPAPLVDWRVQATCEPAALLDARCRAIVLAAFSDACLQRDWSLLAAHVRRTHVHLVVGAPQGARAVIAYCKARATHALRTAGWATARTWAAGGSYRKLESDGAVDRAVEYVIHGQGRPMAVIGG